MGSNGERRNGVFGDAIDLSGEKVKGGRRDTGERELKNMRRKREITKNRLYFTGTKG